MSSEDSVICPNVGCGERVPTDYVLCPYCGYNLMTKIKEKIRSKVTLRESINRIRKLVPLRHPQLIKNKTIECMEEVATNFDRKGPFIILFLVTFSFSFKFAPYIMHLAASNSLGVPLQFILIAYFLTIPILAGILLWPIMYIIWRVIAFLIHFPCKYTGGGGGQKETQSVAGYALLPIFIGEIIINILLIFLLSGDLQPGSSGFPTIVESAALFEVLLIIPFFVWTGIIAMIGLAKVHNINYSVSGGIAGVFIFIYYALFTFPFYLSVAV